MKAWRIVSAGKLEMCNVPMPKPSDNGVIIKVDACGVCHSDLYIINGYMDLGEGKRLMLDQFGTKFPLTPGHEIAGTVHEVGSNVKGLSVGEKVLVYPWIGCDVCRACAVGLNMLCDNQQYIGAHIDGGYAEYVYVPHYRYALKIGNLNPEEVAPLSCSGITAFHALNEAKVESDELLVIIGVGGLGSIAIQLAKKLKNVNLAAIDVDEKKLSFASELGSDYVINPMKEDPLNSLLKMHGSGADAVIDFVNSSRTAEMAFNLLNKGGRQVCVGHYGGAINIPLNILTLKSIKIIGSHVGTIRELMELINLAQRGVIKPVVSTYRLEDAKVVLEKLNKGEIVGRAILTP